MKELLIVRILRGVSSTNERGCWLWGGATRGGADGDYGSMKVEGVAASVPRTVLAMALGRSLAPDELALHRCDVKLCVNPLHLYAGSRSDNYRDAVDSGKGKLRPRRKGEGRNRGIHVSLTANQISEIRERWSRRENARDIARAVGTSKSTVRRVCRKQAA